MEGKTNKGTVTNDTIRKIEKKELIKNKRNELTLQFLQKLLEESNEHLYVIIKNYSASNI